MRDSRKGWLMWAAAPLAVVAVVAAGTTAVAQPDPEPQGVSPDRVAGYEIGLFGDMPYGERGRQEYPNLIADMNSSTLAFSVFDGDIKNGAERCDDSIYTQALTGFDVQRSPVVYVPGDNEWTDCDRPSAGGFDPDERLAHLRTIFYSTDRSLGRHTIGLTRQSAAFPENVRWRRGPVTYAGLNVPGSNNNLVHDPADGDPAEALAEYTARNAANLRWLREAFAAARSNHSRALMLVIQADPDFEGRFTTPTDGFADTKNLLRQLVIANPDLQVVLVHGDSHFFELDKPLADSSGQTLENFTRVQTFGDANTHWVSATVNPNDPNVFEFHQRIVPANVHQHTD